MAKKQSTDVAETPPEASSETGLSVLESSRFLALRPGGDLAEALEANLGSGDSLKESDLTRVKIPSGGATRWVIDGLRGEEVAEELVGVLVYYAPRGVLWPSQEVGNDLPVLISDDLRTARRVGEKIGDLDEEILDKMLLADGRYDWRGTDESGPNKYNDFGSGKNGQGKRAKESRVLCLLREREAFPILVNATPGSLKTVVPFVKKLEVPHFRAIVSLKLAKVKNRGGIDFAQIVPTLVGEISKEEGAKIRELYTNPLRKLVSAMIPKADDYRTSEE